MEKPGKYFENNVQSMEYLLGQRDDTRARQVLGWQPRYGLPKIVETSWRWYSTHPHGYESD